VFSAGPADLFVLPTACAVPIAPIIWIARPDQLQLVATYDPFLPYCHFLGPIEK